ncbi:MAG: class I SAM-dependent methyltransferase [Maribacter sp.]|nr:class I SAM-dependent methyltransferase [Maribacter sp.]
MIQTGIFDKNVEEYEKWYEDYSEVYQSELAAIKEQLLKLPENIRGIEVGLGTGRFALPLGIKEGVEPSEAMAEKAIKRGIEIIDGVAEKLPYGDMQFDFVLFVTICHLDNINKAFAEAYRVLKPKGSILIGFLDKDQRIAKEYLEKRNRSTFFANANFYTVDRIKSILKEARFKDLEFNQTLFDDLDEIKKIQMPKDGFGEGSFVVVKATKK